MSTTERIVQILQQALAATSVTVEDESARHVGHVGAAAGGGHYRVTVVSPLFVGKSAVARHRLVYDALAGEMGTTIHALALTTLAPGEDPAPRKR
ncbi:MAG: BolA family transcriptional regulator [Candidatus Binatia bacterium]|nr:BolA family transcriptional regulator [Candidatus Binatia bacterium]